MDRGSQGSRGLRVVICGSRDWTDIATVARRVGELPDESIVIHGGADGADKMAGQTAQMRGLHTAVVHPLWAYFRRAGKGNSAGHIRNAKMLDLDPELVIAFSLGTNGTQGTIDEARRRNIPVEVIGTEAGTATEPTPRAPASASSETPK